MRALFLFFTLLFLFSCDKGKEKQNISPDTTIAFEEINLTGENRLTSKVTLSWFGTDKDGYIEKFEYSTDNIVWHSTKTQDSIFQFSINSGSDTVDVDFYVRSIDNDGAYDETPAYLKIPLKNSPPIALFDEAALPNDTTKLVVTFRWLYQDPDGDETVKQAFIKANKGDWYEIPITISSRVISFVPTNAEVSGIQEAKVYLDGKLQSINIKGFNNNGMNEFYLKVVDVANTESRIDSSNQIFVSQKNANILMISAQEQKIVDKYKDLFNSSTVNLTFDKVDYNGGNKQPKFWNPTFKLLAEHYDLLFVHADGGSFTNQLSNEAGLLLHFMSTVIGDFVEKGGKVFVTASFNKDNDLTNVKQSFPIDSVSRTGGQARIMTDDSMYFDSSYDPNISPIPPNLTPTFVIPGATPMHITTDSQPFYKIQVTKIAGWDGPDIAGAVKVDQLNNPYMVLFSFELHLFNKDKPAQEELFRYVLKDMLGA